MSRYTLDRFEGEWAILEDQEGRPVQVPRDQLPSGTKEGTVLDRDKDIWTVNEAQSDLIRRAVRMRMDRLRGKD
jgi:hypothetical protein